MNDVIEAESRALAVREEPQALPRPSVTPADAKAAMQAYLELCDAVLEPSDYQEFSQKKKVDGRWVSEKKRFKKKSAVKKLQTFFDVEVTVKSADRDELGDGHYAFRVIASARARNGRLVEATGACSTLEERFDLQPFDDESEARFAGRQRKALARAYHDVLSTAETRATNRAVMNCIGVGGGEVTADEVQRDRQQSAPRKKTTTDETPEPKSEADRRKNGIAAVHALKNERRVTDKQYRDLMASLFGDACYDEYGKPSSKMLDVKQLREFWRELDARTKEAVPA